MIILEVRQTELDREITALRELPFESEVMEAFYGGARIALEWLRDGSAAPSRMWTAAVTSPVAASKRREADT
jgi:succinylarginine dihydrolase